MTSPSSEPVRIDAWIWAVRIVKTRTRAGATCKAGHVKINGTTAKPSQLVAPGDRVSVWVEHRNLELEVTQTLKKRVSATIARTCYVDHSPPPPPREILVSQPRRDRGAGRPTKKERRQLDRLRGRSDEL
ncbi:MULTISPECIES: RNA-binding S4 domain-containing protein [unclassified Corynebacterium]|uniref:RNA-binding S4 domain-containing protein n=1 Tax=unclassified Corynebacterium TaxID=2624378 RepID=UPI001C48DBE1|nr:RNA-binding S4 domain-containing protein [Corynebacterium sp. TAE3-ERU30]MBV7301267.1 RNA-binding S4 domain-containing protein [Corynebacterium sp. TAE3-ERU2]